MKIDPKKELLKLMDGKTREQLAQELDISPTQLSFCLTGKREPSKGLLAKLGLERRIKREYVRAGAAGLNGKDRRRAANRG